jgi:hypothetical protein
LWDYAEIAADVYNWLVTSLDESKHGITAVAEAGIG